MHTGLHRASWEVAVTAMIEDLSTRLEGVVIEVPSAGSLDAPGLVIARTGRAKATVLAGIEKAAGRCRLIRRGPP